MITLVLSDQDVSAVMEGLSNLPLHKAFDTFVNVRQQVVQQRQAQQGPQQGQQGQQGQQATPPTPPKDDGKADTTGGQPNGRVPN